MLLESQWLYSLRILYKWCCGSYEYHRNSSPLLSSYDVGCVYAWRPSRSSPISQFTLNQSFSCWRNELVMLPVTISLSARLQKGLWLHKGSQTRRGQSQRRSDHNLGEQIMNMARAGMLHCHYQSSCKASKSLDEQARIMLQLLCQTSSLMGVTINAPGSKCHWSLLWRAAAPLVYINQATPNTGSASSKQ